MKAFLLAAGNGTRLRPLTDKIPKCLVPINGRPLLAYWLNSIRAAAIDEVLVNTHHLPSLIQEFVKEWAPPPIVHLTFEPQLLGSAGTLLRNKSFVEAQEDFYILYADNLTNIDLGDIWKFHSRHKASIFSLASYRSPIPESKGILTVDDQGCVLSFEEKPKSPRSNLANSGIGVASARIFEYIEDKIPQDIGRDVMPKLIGAMYSLETNAYIRDIGTYEDYVSASAEWLSLSNTRGLP